MLKNLPDHWTGYFSNSTGSSVTNCRFSLVIAQLSHLIAVINGLIAWHACMKLESCGDDLVVMWPVIHQLLRTWTGIRGPWPSLFSIYKNVSLTPLLLLQLKPYHGQRRRSRKEEEEEWGWSRCELNCLPSSSESGQLHDQRNVC